MPEKQKLSIGIVSPAAAAFTNPQSGLPMGGAELQLVLLARALARRPDFMVTLYVAETGQPEREENGVLIRPFVRLRPSLSIPIIAMPGIIHRLARAGHDLYITRSASGINGLVRLASRRARSRYMHMCASDPECCAKADPSLSAPGRWVHHMGLRDADMLTCQSIRQQQLLREHFCRDAVIVHNLSPCTEAACDSGQRRNGFLWVGRDIEVKQPELFIQLARHMPDQDFTMICQPQPGHDLERLRSDAPPNLTFVPGLSFAETTKLYARHRALVCTSSVEGFPNTFIQAACAGTPVISLCVDPDGILARSGAGAVGDGTLDSIIPHIHQLASGDSKVWEAFQQGASQLILDRLEAEAHLVNLARSLARKE